MVLFGSDESIVETTHEMLKEGLENGTKYVANLGWGMVPEHDPEKLGVFIEAVHSYKIPE